MIKDTTVEAFTIMINYIYMAPGERKFSLAHVTCPQTLCEILNVSERFQLPGLSAIVKDVLKVLPITAENMLFTVATAKNYSVFKDVSKILMAKCDTFLAETLKTAEDVFSFMLQSKETFPIFDSELLQDLFQGASGQTPAVHCSNCGRKTGDCLDGQVVTGEEEPPTVRVGLVVKTAGDDTAGTVTGLTAKKTVMEKLLNVGGKGVLKVCINTKVREGVIN